MNHYNIYKILLFIILINFEESTINNDVYKIPFGLINIKISNNTSDIINNIIYNTIYVNLSIGTPPQIIPFELSSNSQTFSVPVSQFAQNKSSSFEYVSKNEISYEYEDVTDGYNCKDVLNLNNITKKQKINFILGTKYENKNNVLGIIGLKIPKRVQFGVYPFFHSLRNAGYINSYTWTLKYFDNVSLIDTIYYNKNKNNIIGEFIFGDDPHNYESEKEKYNLTEYYKVTPLSSNGDIYWDIEFSSIYILSKNNSETSENKNKISKINIEGSKKAQILPELGFMVGPKEFYESIKENFFKKYIEQNICQEKKISIYFYNYIECNYNSIFKVNTFPNICFEHIGFETIFNLTYKDLFIVDKINNKYIFLIFYKEHYSNWVVGPIFLRKFQFVFNEDFKTIGYYKSTDYFRGVDDVQRGEKQINNDENIKYAFLIILIFVFSFLLILFGMFCQKKFFNRNRKIRANELEDNFSYESNFNNNKDYKNKKIINEEENNQKYYSI